MKFIGKTLLYAVIIVVAIVVNSLFFLHHPPEVQLVFITPGFILLAYSIISDDLRAKHIKWARGR